MTPMPTSASSPCDSLAVYVHVPFCGHKCSYCDFNAYSGLGALRERYAVALAREITRSPDEGRPVSSVYFGGGTPTQLSGVQLADLLGVVFDQFAVLDDAEITSEANPSSADVESFGRMRQAGFNRISIGLQAFQAPLLQLLERDHTAEEAQAAVRKARLAGFENVSVDLMFRLPGQTLAMWRETLERAIGLYTEHLSLYSLTIEPGTRFERLNAGGRLAIPHDDLDAEMFELAIERLSAAGFHHYEISNFAKPGYESRHNQVYWHNREYAGFGAGAVSYQDGVRSMNEKYPPRYIEAVLAGQSPIVEEERLGAEDSLAESLILGMRLVGGVPIDSIQKRHGVDPREHFRETLNNLRWKGWIEANSDTIRLTRKGLLLADEVALAFLP